MAISGTDLDFDASDSLAIDESELVTTTNHVRLKVVDMIGNFGPDRIAVPLSWANRVFRPAGLQFDFDALVDVIRPNPSLPDCANATIGAYGDNVIGRGSVAVFYCSRGNESNLNGSNWVAWNGSQGFTLAHELGHYFGLNHTFGSYVPTDLDTSVDPINPANSRLDSVEREIRSRLEPVPAGATIPPWILQRGFAIRDELLDADGLPDTKISLEQHFIRSGDPCDPNLRVSLPVTFSSGQVYDYGFTPARRNPMGYYLGDNCDLAQRFVFSPSQLLLIRHAYLVGARSPLTRTLVNDGVTPAPAGMSIWSGSSNGWDVSRYQDPVAYPDLNGDETADVCGRGVGGVWCSISTRSTFGPATLWTSNFSDGAGWNAEQYHSTLRFPDLNGDGRADICGRGVAGIWCGLSNNSGAGFSGPTLWLAQFTDAQGWNAPQYYSTLTFVDLDNDRRADVCGRGVAGVWCARSNGTSAFTNFSQWTPVLSDAQGWNQPMRYRTIKFPDVNRDGMADICTGGPFGISCAISLGDRFGGFTNWSPSFSDANGWDQERYYSTIAFADINGDGRADVCGRGISGILCGTSTGTTFGPVQLWTPAFSDFSGGNLASTYKTISFPDHDGDGIADVCGRTSGGMHCASSSGTSFVDYLPATIAHSDANGWSDPARYRTIVFADVDHDGAAELCSRDANGISCETP